MQMCGGRSRLHAITWRGVNPPIKAVLNLDVENVRTNQRCFYLVDVGPMNQSILKSLFGAIL